MKTTLFGSKIIASAEEVLGIGYRAGNSNYYGEKLEEVVKEFDSVEGTRFFTGKGKKQPDYCAITASVILDRAVKKYNGSQNIIRNASANGLGSAAKSKGIRVDKKPSVGSLFLYERNEKGQGHIGFVWKVYDNYIETIEGNTESCSSYIIKGGCPVKLNCGEYGILTRVRKAPYITSKNKAYSFIHIEELFGTELDIFPDSENYLADGNSCDMKEVDLDNYDEGSEGEINEPKERSFLEQYKTELLIGGGLLGFIGLCFLFKDD